MYFLLRNKYFIPTKFHQNPSSGSGEEIENVKSLQMDGRVDGQRTARYDNSLKLSLSIFNFHIRLEKGLGKSLTTLNVPSPYNTVSLKLLEPSSQVS